MKKVWLFSLLMVACIVSALSITGGAVMAQENAKEITVTGVYEHRVTPDTAVVSVGVESTNEDISVAQQDNTEKMNGIILVLKNKGIAEKDIKTKNFSVYQRYDYSEGTGKVVGFTVSNYLDFKTKDLDNLGGLISSIMDKGANYFNGINFTLEDMDSAYNIALSKALENAKTKAQSINPDASLNIKEIVEESISSFGAYDSYVYSNFLKESTPVLKGEIVIKARLKVVFGA